MSVVLIAHVVLSLIGIAAGLGEVSAWITSRDAPRSRAWFLWSSLATSVTGYALPAKGILPSHIVGAVSLVALAIAFVALYRRGLAGRWRVAYVVAAALALYLNLFVGVVQAFLRVPFLTTLAPTQSEPPFAVAQGLLFLLFLGAVAAGITSARGTLVAPSRSITS